MFADGVQVSWTPSNGTTTQTTKCIFDVVEVARDYGGFDATEKEIEITYDAAVLTNLRRDELVVIDGTTYRVRDVQLIDDGLLRRATLGDY